MCIFMTLVQLFAAVNHTHIAMEYGNNILHDVDIFDLIFISL